VRCKHDKFLLDYVQFSDSSGDTFETGSQQGTRIGLMLFHLCLNFKLFGACHNMGACQNETGKQWCSFVEFWKTNHERKWQMKCGDRGIWYLWKSKNLKKNALLNMREDGKWNVAFGGYGTCGN
jgi:hypothetical protein